jgi:hypothetical protein
MSNQYLPEDMPPKLTGHLIRLFEQHFGRTLRKIKDPQTAQEYVDMAQVCDILGLDVEDERAKLLADPVLGESVAVFEPGATRPPLMEPADMQAHRIGICNPNTCGFCRTASNGH